MDTGLVGKGVGTHDSLVALDFHAGNFGDQTRRAINLACVDARFQTIKILTRVEIHDDLLQRGIAGAFADAVDGALHLAGTIAQC